MSYDVIALFTSIPIDTTINIIKKQLQEDKDLQSRTNMTIKNICCLLEFCLKNTYFKFNGEFYEQKEGAAMGSPISPIVVNLFMEDLEIKAIRTSNTPPKIWRRFVDDTFTIIKKENRNNFLQHLNSIHPNIKFTCEEMKGRWINAISRYPDNSSRRWQFENISVQETNSHWSVPALGQPPQYTI